MELEILKSLGDVIAVNKPAGWLSIPGRGDKEDIPILSNRLGTFLRGGAERKPGTPDLYIVHRLDQGTSGVILFAKTAQAHKTLSHSFEEGLVKKTYWALVKGEFPKEPQLIDAPLFKLPSKKNKSIIDVKGKPSQTKVKLRKTNGEISWIEAEPLTGRTHQIRVHLSHLGFPLLGDKLYGGPENFQSQTLEYPLLHSQTVEFKWPAEETNIVSAQVRGVFTEVLQFL